MSEQPFEQLEERLQAAKESFPYPPTPNLAHVVGHKAAQQRTRRAPFQRLAWLALLVAILGAGLFASPDVRAAVRDFLQLGAVRIIPAPTTIATPLRPTSTPLARVQPGLAGKTTFAEAEREAGFPIRLPTYPDDVGDTRRDLSAAYGRAGRRPCLVGAGGAGADPLCPPPACARHIRAKNRTTRCSGDIGQWTTGVLDERPIHAGISRRAGQSIYQHRATHRTDTC